ncbi:hypothetical protein ES708_18916 [subsurface metagenome]
MNRFKEYFQNSKAGRIFVITVFTFCLIITPIISVTIIFNLTISDNVIDTVRINLDINYQLRLVFSILLSVVSLFLSIFLFITLKERIVFLAVLPFFQSIIFYFIAQYFSKGILTFDDVDNLSNLSLTMCYVSLALFSTIMLWLIYAKTIRKKLLNRD